MQNNGMYLNKLQMKDIILYHIYNHFPLLFIQVSYKVITISVIENKLLYS